jgi:carboxyl-terminal processing protease
MLRTIIYASLFALASGCSLLGGNPGGGIHARMGYSESSGLRVVDVPPGGTAATAGLIEGDLITFIDGEPVSEMDMSEVVERLRGPVGSHVTLAIVRDGEELELDVERQPYER